MKRRYKFLSHAFAVALISLTPPVVMGQEEGQEEVANSEEVSVVTTTNQLSSEYYRAVITDGKYKLGASATGYANISSAANIRAFEDGLLRISKSIFPTDQYYLQEGQVINEETLTSWLARESATNPDGLNPALAQEEAQAQESIEAEMAEGESVSPSDDPETASESEESQQVVTNVQSTPVYLAQIMEKNLMVETEDGFQLGGIVLGLAMNSTYEYTDGEGGVHQQEISVGEMRERGKQFANIIVGRLRNTEELRSIPIVVGVYRMSGDNETVGGSYLLDGISREGNAVTDWTENNEYRVALPTLNADNADQYTYFDTFNNEIVNFFPNLNGISGEAVYINDSLSSLSVEIVTQFYQQTEITALTQHVTDVAQRNLPEGVGIEIKITSDAGTEAYIGRPMGATQFQNHIFQR